MAGGAALVSLISYIWTPKNIIFPFTLAVYLLLSTTTAALILSTGNASSVFIALWMLLSIFAGVFGLWGAMPIFVATCIFTAAQYIGGDFSLEVALVIIFSSILPTIIGSIVWHQKQDGQAPDSENRAYRNLANELTEVASKSEVVINAIGDGVIAIDSKGVIQLINPAAQRIIGWGKQDAITLNYKSVLQLVNQANEPLDLANDPIQQVLNTNQQVRTNDLALMTNSGKKIMISLVASPVGDMGSGIIAVFHDITKEKAVEREQAEFISTASHEMRTPVAAIEGYLGLALSPQTAQIDIRARDYIMKAHASAQHLGHLFQDLLDVSKTDDGRISNNPKVINIVTFTHDIVQGLQAKAAEKGLELIYKPMPNDNAMDKTIPPVYSVNLDNDHIREIINNLIENAIKYTPKGEIVVDVNGDEDNVTVSIKDNGIGIPVEDMSHLFQKFYRVDNKDTREIGGTGLGLYLSRRLAETMGGRMWAESIYTKGSTFYVMLPRISNQEASRIADQEVLTAQEEANQKATIQPEQAVFAPTPQSTTTAPVISQPNTVPRGQALTSQQIAAYVAQQRVLAQQVRQQPQTTPQPPPNRPQTITIPVRGPQQ